MSHPRRSTVATRILAALGTAVAIALGAAGTGGLGEVTPGLAQASALTKAAGGRRRGLREGLARVQSDPRASGGRRSMAKQVLPNLPGQAIYLARIKVMSTYKDLTDMRCHRASGGPTGSACRRPTSMPTSSR